MTPPTIASQSFEALKAYVERNEYKGWDPYDGLNSIVFQHTPLRKSSWARLAWIQFFKRSPVNFRGLLGVPRQYNSKGLGLFLSGYVNLYHQSSTPETLSVIHFLIGKIKESVRPGYSGACWGYNFDWQARAFFQPEGTPTVVATTYVASALLDAYDITRDESLLAMARSSCDFILKDLNRTPDDRGNFCFSYSPLDSTQVFNASLLGSRLLARVYHHTREEILLSEANRSVAFCCTRQRPDGSWSYGTLPFHAWIDNFHTGFNLECLDDYLKYGGDTSFRENYDKGMKYYLENFFTTEGKCKYYNNQLYPIDIHGPAQLIIMLCKARKLPAHRVLADSVLKWTIFNMQDQSGYFYYQLKAWGSSRIPYMRWAQAWMFCALSHYLRDTSNEQSN